MLRLTVDVERNSFADGGWDVVGRDAHVSGHHLAGDSVKAQRLSVICLDFFGCIRRVKDKAVDDDDDDRQKEIKMKGIFNRKGNEKEFQFIIGSPRRIRILRIYRTERNIWLVMKNRYDKQYPNPRAMTWPYQLFHQWTRTWLNCWDIYLICRIEFTAARQIFQIHLWYGFSNFNCGSFR